MTPIQRTNVTEIDRRRTKQGTHAWTDGWTEITTVDRSLSVGSMAHACTLTLSNLAVPHIRARGRMEIVECNVAVNLVFAVVGISSEARAVRLGIAVIPQDICRQASYNNITSGR
jgi:hypothetical protein